MYDKHYNQNFRIKTEKALEIINHHEDIETLYLMNLTKMKEQITTKANCKMLREGEWNKIQLLKGTSELYQMINSHLKNQWSSSAQQPILNFKLVIKNFTGVGVHLTMSSKPQLVSYNDCEYKIDGDKIIKIRNCSKNTNKIYLTIHSPTDLTIFKLKYEFQMEGKTQRVQSLQSSSVKLIKINSIRDIKSSRHVAENDKEEIFLNLKRGNVSPRSIVIKDRSDLQTARLKSIQRQKQKIMNAKSKKVDLQVYRQKNKSFKALSNQCTTVFKQYQQRVNVYLSKRQKTTKEIALLLCTAIFLRNLDLKIIGEKENLDKATKKHKTVKRCALKFMKLLQSVKMLQPRRLPRALIPVHHHIILTAKTLLKKDSQSAKEIVAQCIQRTTVAFSLNLSFEKCALYRRKVRMFQKFWLNRHKAQLLMFQCYVQKQLTDILAKFPKFIVVKQQFFARNMIFKLSWQYLKQSSEKIKAIFTTYRSKLIYIEDIKKANQQIDEFNKRSLKKYQKEFIEVPQTPSVPQYRYFRDLGILKAMVRSWLEIEFRKFARKLKKQNEMSPPKQSSLTKQLSPKKQEK